MHGERRRCDAAGAAEAVGSMAIELDVILGRDYMRAAAQGDVIALLAALPRPAHEKRWLYGQWARQVGVPLRIEDLERVAAAGRPAQAGEHGG